MITHHIKITHPTAHQILWRRKGVTTRGERLKKEFSYMWEIDIPRTFFNQEKYELLIGIGSPSADGQNDSRKSHWLCNEKSHVYHLEPNTLVNYTNYQHSSITFHV